MKPRSEYSLIAVITATIPHVRGTDGSDITILRLFWVSLEVGGRVEGETKDGPQKVSGASCGREIGIAPRAVVQRLEKSRRLLVRAGDLATADDGMWRDF